MSIDSSLEIGSLWDVKCDTFELLYKLDFSVFKIFYNKDLQIIIGKMKLKTNIFLFGVHLNIQTLH